MYCLNQLLMYSCLSLLITYLKWLSFVIVYQETFLSFLDHKKNVSVNPLSCQLPSIISVAMLLLLLHCFSVIKFSVFLSALYLCFTDGV